VITAKNFWFWFSGIWLAIGLVFLGTGVAVGVYGARLDARFAAQGRDVEGVVLGKEISYSSNDSPSYRVTFRFPAEGGEARRGSAELEPEAWDALTERGPIELTYLRDRPQTYRVPGQHDAKATISLVFGGVGAALASVGGFLLFTALRNRRRERELDRSGVSAAATVIDVAPGNLRINGVPQWTLRYRFADARGHSHDGQCAVSAQEAQGWQTGATGRVRYDSRNPRSHHWTGRS
jgi:Protein of unknown function (DUF3592)